ncbi:sulfite exporter TauE/SafE family protein [Clostridium minihomine]|uniref:sulfite exporter TauE/SafE family protein n=1 Tax=Clostridium minihomine TaxID=2045012 RepID=UPI000C766CCC|nr:sulfite exporter TauE/SafE family protein [Clostridium minihomine]
MKRPFHVLGGFLAGIANGLLGAGGGMIVVPMLKKSGLPVVNSHATSVAVILPICILSAGLYLYRGSVTFGQALPYLPWMLAGSVIGSWALPKLNKTLLRRLFGALMLWAAWRMLF